MDDLKPCPFCGSDPVPEFYSSEDGSGYATHCQAEACPAWPSVHGVDENEAITAWNTRAPDPRLAEVEAERDGLRAALLPDGDTKAAYMGEFSFNITEYGDDGGEIARKIYVPWTTIKEIMAAIKARAALGDKP